MTSKDVIARNIQHYRERRGLNQEQLADLVGVSKRQIGRYEQADSEPPASVFLKIAEVLDVSTAELGGELPSGPNLGGQWWAAWQTWKDDVERIDVHTMHIRQEGDFLILEGDRAQGPESIEKGDYAWRGWLRLHRPTSTLIGWYESDDEGVNTAGAYYFKLHPQGTHAPGYWVGEDYDGIVVHGWGVLARSKALAEQQIAAVIENATSADNPAGNLRTWLKTS
jgi:transcriptional regulator with XRE-family HTH domain